MTIEEPKSSVVAEAVFPVGSFILDEMLERDWTIDDLIERMGGDDVTRLTVELLIHAPTKGVTIDQETAIRLSAAFGTSKELWLKLDEMWQNNTKSL